MVSRLRWLEKKTWTNRYLMKTTAFGVALFVMFCLLPMAGTNQVSKAEPSDEPGEEIVLERFELPSVSPYDLNVTIKKVPRLLAAVLPIHGDYNQLATAVDKLKSELQSQGIKPTGFPFGRFYSDPEKVQEQFAWWEVGMQIPEGTRVSQPLESVKVAEQQVASVVIEGVRETDATWREFIERIADRGYVPSYPPAVEVWCGAEADKEFWWRTELQIQVLRPDESYPGLTMSVREVEPFKAVVLPGHGYYNSKIEDAIDRLKQYLDQNRIKTAGPPFGRFYSSPSETPLDAGYWEIGMPVVEKIEVEWPFELKEYEGGKVGSAICRGTFNTEYPWAPFVTKLVLQGSIPVPPGMKSGTRGSKISKPLNSRPKCRFLFCLMSPNPGKISGKPAEASAKQWQIGAENWDEYSRIGEREVPSFPPMI